MIILFLFCFYIVVNFCVWCRIDEEFGKFRYFSFDVEILYGWIIIWFVWFYVFLVIIFGNNFCLRIICDGVSKEGKFEEKEKVY